MNNDASTLRSRWRKVALPTVLGAAAGMAAALATSYTAPSAPDAEPAFVTFDTARYINARRAAASRLLGDDREAAEATISSLSRVDRGVVPTIQDHAGDRLVLVRQAVVLEGSVPDITGEVLESLGLPTDAPSIHLDPESMPDTTYRHSPLYEFAERAVREANRKARDGQEADHDLDLDEWLP